MIDPGALNCRLVLEQPVETADDQGGVIRTYEEVTTLWASLTPIRARSRVVADSLAQTATHRITIRDNFDVTPRHRFRDGDDIYRIVTVGDGDSGFITVEAERRID